MFLFQPDHKRKGGIYRYPVRSGGIDPGSHGVEKDIGEGFADTSIAETLQGLITRVTFGPNEHLGGDSQFLRQTQELRGNECRRGFRQAMQPVGKNVALARKVRAGQQQVFGRRHPCTSCMLSGLFVRKPLPPASKRKPSHSTVRMVPPGTALAS